MNTKTIQQIDEARQYTLKEIEKEGLIPGITGYSAIYNLVTQKLPCKENKLGYTRKLQERTTNTSLKAHNGKPWAKIMGNITVEGADIIKFRKMNGLT